MNNRFFEWIGLKKKLNDKNDIVPHVNEGDIWWISVGENIGREINGKSRKFSRPVIIFKKLAHGFYFVIPASTQIKNSSWYIYYQCQSIEAVACLHQARAVDHRRLLERMGELDSNDFGRIRDGFIKLYT